MTQIRELFSSKYDQNFQGLKNYFKKKNTATEAQNFYRDCIIFPKIFVQSITKVTKQKELSM